MSENKKKGNNSPPFRPTDLEQNIRDAPLGQEKVKRFASRVNLHIHSIRKRLVDPDGVSAKAVIDGIVKTGILQDDSTEFINQVSYSQEKGKEEKTIITIEEV